MRIFQEDISEKIWDLKYRYRLNDQVIDESIEHTWQRVARAVAKAESIPNQAKWEQQFLDILTHFKFLPGGRILAGAGTSHEVTLFNCFVMSIAEDTLPAVFDALREGAITLQYGGGMGYDFSILRPRGYPVLHTGTLASGPVAFMRIWDAMCATMESTRSRNGTMMGILRCDHPDIEAFIAAKSDSHELRHFNLSVLITDEFIHAVKENREWELVFPAGENNYSDTILRHWSDSAEPIACRVVRRVRAVELWEKIIRAVHITSQLNVLFEDTINRQNNLWYREWISATNPCGEMPLPLYGASNLGAINLTQFVLRPFTPDADLDWNGIQTTISIATRFLDNVIDISHFPLSTQRQGARLTRRIGLGMTGLANVFVMLGIPYGSEQSFIFAEKIAKYISESTWKASIELAKERGVFQVFHSRKYLQGNFVTRLPTEIRQAIEKYGIRHSHHNAIAPTTSTSILANYISNGIEPIFRGQYQPTISTPNDTQLSFSVTDYALRIWQQQGHTELLPPAWRDVYSLTPLDHVKMQAAIQPYIDNAIAKTIYLPKNFSFDELVDIFTTAAHSELKGCTFSHLEN